MGQGSCVRRIVCALCSSIAVAAAAILPLNAQRGVDASREVNKGQPYADPAYCKGLPALITKLEAGLPQQEEWIRRTEAQLEAAREGRREASGETNKELLATVVDFGADQMKTARVLRERVEALKNSGMTKDQRRRWLERIFVLEEAGKAMTRMKAGNELQDEINKNQLTLDSFRKFAEESGVAEDVATALGNAVVPELGGLTVKGLFALQKIAYAHMKESMTAAEEQQARNNLDRMKAAHDEVASRIAGYRQDLTGGLCGPKIAQEVQSSPKPVPMQDMAASGTQPSPPKQGGSKAAKIAAGVAVGAGAGVGAAVLASKLADSIYDSSTSSSSGSSGSSGGSSTSTTATITGGSLTCTLTSGGASRNCNGTVSIRLGPSVSGGIGLTAISRPSGITGHATPSSSGSGLTIAFTFTQAALGGSSCPGSQTFGIIAATNTSTAIAVTTNSLSVTCN